LKPAAGRPAPPYEQSTCGDRKLQSITTALCLLAFALVLGLASSAAEVVVRPLGPAPRDADGLFENWIPGLPRAGPSVTLPFFFRRLMATFREPVGIPERVPPEIARLRANTTLREPLVTWVGHATLLVQMSHVTFLTDPIWSETAGPAGLGAKRYDEPGFPIDDLPLIDFVLVSHNHYDHLDLASLTRISQDHPEARFFVPLGNAALLQEAGIANVEELDWGDTRKLGEVTVHCLPAQHWSQRGLTDARRTLWSSWAVTSPERRFYFGGDTGLFAGFDVIGRRLGPFDLSAVPIGAYEPEAMMFFAHMNPEQAVTAAIATRARRMLGMHFGTFDLSDEPIDEPPRRFRRAAKAAGIAEEDVWILKLGETRPF
jgi:N-acyl-phosphatidylethanolamine-hydrolysing phospholipase D